MTEESDSVLDGRSDNQSQEDLKDSNEEINEIKEMLEKKDTIIKDQTNQIEEMKKELKESRLKVRNHVEKENKFLATLIDKDECIKKMNVKLSGLSTREMQNLKEKVKKKKISQGVQTEYECEEESKLINSFSILDKLPSMKNKTHETNASITGKRFLNVNTVRGQHDRCFNCFDLEKKIKDLTKKNTLMKKQISEYQESLGRAACVETRKTTGKGEEKLDADTGDPNENEVRQKENNDAIMGVAVDDQSGERGVIPQSGNVKKMDEQTGNEKKMNKQSVSGKKMEERDGETQGTDKEGCFEQDGTGTGSGGETDGVGDNDNSEEYFKERDSIEEYFKRRDQERKKNMDEQKDHSPLCNDYVWSGECWRRGCRFTHKKLCRKLEKEGVCAVDACRDGHNTKSVCRYFNDKGCRYSVETCRYLHIKINNSEKRGGENQINHPRKMCEKADDRNASSGEDVISTEKDECINEEGNSSGVSVSGESFSEGTEVTGSNTEKTREIEETNLMCIDEWYHEESDEESGCGDQGKTASTEVVTKDGKDKTDIKEKRDLLDFLRMDIKHDVWKEIKATKAEIRKLEKEVREKRRPEDRSQ